VLTSESLMAVSVPVADEILALVQHWDKSLDGTIFYPEFVEALRAAAKPMPTH